MFTRMDKLLAVYRLQHMKNVLNDYASVRSLLSLKMIELLNKNKRAQI